MHENEAISLLDEVNESHPSRELYPSCFSGAFECIGILFIHAQQQQHSGVFNLIKFSKHFMDFMSINFRCAVHYPCTSWASSSYLSGCGIHKKINSNYFMVVSYDCEKAINLGILLDFVFFLTQHKRILWIFIRAKTHAKRHRQPSCM